MNSDTIIETKCDLISWSAWFGKSPVGSEQDSWDWYEDDYGCKEKCHFTIIEDVEETRELDGTGGTLTLEGILLNAQPEDVVMLNVKFGTDSFLCMGWQRHSKALTSMREFLTRVQ